MRDYRNPRTHIGQPRQIELSIPQPRRLAHVEQHLASWIDDQRMAIGRSPVLMHTGLRRRDDERCGLDRTRA